MYKQFTTQMLFKCVKILSTYCTIDVNYWENLYYFLQLTVVCIYFKIKI